MAFYNPLKRFGASSHRQRPALWDRLARLVAFSLPALVFFFAAAPPAAAQGISIIRDTEIERVLYGYERPLLEAAGIDPSSVKLYINNDPSFNAFATQSPITGESEDIFINTGLILTCKVPNEAIGVLAHETGHIAGGDVIRGGMAMEKATVPMLIGMVVGVAAMIAGAGQAGMGAMMLGQSAAMSQYLQFSRAQEATADQRAITYLNRTHQSGEGMVHVFERMANEQAMSANYDRTFVSDHPADRERIDALSNRVDASPWKNRTDSPQAMHEWHMIQAKLFGYLADPDEVLRRFPESDQSEPALYARAMAYFRMPNMKMALKEIDTLIKHEPNNPYFREMLGQIYVEMSQPKKGIAPYQKAVDLLPDAPQIRVALAAAQLASEKPADVKPALENLKVALQQENNDTFGWFEAAQAYSQLGNKPMADLSTAERYYWGGGMKQAVVFAMRAQKGLKMGSMEWQRANDIATAASQQAKDGG